MSWNRVYSQICPQYPNPTRLDFEINSAPLIVSATPIGQLNSFYKLGRLSFLVDLPGIGTTKGKSHVIHRGYQFVDTTQVANYSFKSEFWIYGYVPQVRIDFYTSDEAISPNSREYVLLNASLERIEAKLDNTNNSPSSTSSNFDDPDNSSSLSVI